MIRELVCEADGLVWPIADTQTRPYIEAEAELVEWVTSEARQRRTIVQAGGNCGLYVAEYAQRFDRVVTFEPQGVAFHCLARNADFDNVFPFRAALGDGPGVTGVVADPTHSGAGQARGAGLIPVIPLDALALEVDVIHLDIEGAELTALRGAIKTISRCRPVIAIEVNGLGEGRGFGFNAVVHFFDRLGYRHGGSLFQEHLWLPREKTTVT